MEADLIHEVGKSPCFRLCQSVDFPMLHYLSVVHKNEIFGERLHKAYFMRHEYEILADVFKLVYSIQHFMGEYVGREKPWARPRG